MKDRYDREHRYGDVKFYLSDFYPSSERCRFLILKILEQAVREYCSLANSDIPSERSTWELAKDFLFDDEYRFMWGDIEMSLEVFIDQIDLDVNWVREQAHKKFERGKNG